MSRNYKEGYKGNLQRKLLQRDTIGNFPDLCNNEGVEGDTFDSFRCDGYCCRNCCGVKQPRA